MDVAAAQLAAQPDEDRLFVTSGGVVVLDGATAHDPEMPPAGTYVDVLGGELRDRLDSGRDLRTILAESIEAAAERLSLQPGNAPSSTVAIVRTNCGAVDALVLGDSPIAIGRINGSFDVLSDTRLAELNLPESQGYRERLASGTGYDEIHRSLLQELQRKQRSRRNRDDGYWIAEADPEAAYHALTAHYPIEEVEWAVLATDGASTPLEPLHVSWPQIARMNSDDLDRLLDRCQRWEADHDPHGQLQPRSKRHDDKTIAVAHP
ncbi:hypothetical protein ACFXG4_25770 [Nocardia sp. NPDC059246]|uniref:hypothetical protein n=1 Tax=unclassified Nocardia TaxID=2637762 RepID=UPI0036AC1D6A